MSTKRKILSVGTIIFYVYRKYCDVNHCASAAKLHVKYEKKVIVSHFSTLKS